MYNTSPKQSVSCASAVLFLLCVSRYVLFLLCVAVILIVLVRIHIAGVVPTFARPSKIRGFLAFHFLAGQKKPGFRYRKPRLLLRDYSAVTVFSRSEVLPAALPVSVFAGDAGFSAWNAQALATFPQAFTTDPQLAGQFGLGHVVLMLQNEVLKVVFQ